MVSTRNMQIIHYLSFVSRLSEIRGLGAKEGAKVSSGGCNMLITVGLFVGSFCLNVFVALGRVFLKRTSVANVIIV